MSANAEGAFLLFYDFNSPPRNGIYWCLKGDAELPFGTRVLFGCEADDLLAFGHIVGQRGGLYGVAMEGEPARLAAEDVLRLLTEHRLAGQEEPK